MSGDSTVSGSNGAHATEAVAYVTRHEMRAFVVTETTPLMAELMAARQESRDRDGKMLELLAGMQKQLSDLSQKKKSKAPKRRRRK
jgi:hypothetical protein